MTTKGSMRNMSVLMLMIPYALRPVGERRARAPNRNVPITDPERPPAGEHGEDDGDEAPAADDGVLEDAGD